MNHNFYLMTEPGLEAEAHEEMKEALPFCLDRSQRPQLLDPIESEAQFSGVLLAAPLEVGLQLNFWMKTITRILVRIAQFNSKEFYQLEKELKKTDLKPWLKEKTQIHVRIASSESKLGQEKRILEVCQKVFGARFEVTEDQGQRIYLRAHKDEFVLSLDTSGEALYQRGHLQFRGPAPLRENKAALMLKWMTADLSLYEKMKITWLDPMAGSGTLISECTRLFDKSMDRNFAFEHFQNLPFTLKDRNTKAFQKIDFPKGHRWVASDVSEEALGWMKKNLAREEKVTFFCKDFFQVRTRNEFQILDQEKLFIILNPPYGERIELKSKSEKEIHLNDIFHRCADLKPERFGVLVPERIRSIDIEGYSLSVHKFRNGGLPVQFLVYARK